MVKDCNRAKPNKRFYVDFVASQGYVVLDPNDKLVIAATPFWARADRERSRLQTAADKAAKRGPRPCIRCQTTFHSEGVHNRMCVRCRSMGESEQSVRPAIPARRAG